MSWTISGVLARLDRIGRLLENVALVTMLTSMIILAFGQIVLREVFETVIIWADELIKLMVLWLAMIGSVAACRDERHIRIDALSHLLPDWLVNITRLIVDAFAAVVCVVIAWHAWRYLQLEIEFADQVLVDSPAGIAQVVIPLAFLLRSYRFVLLVLKKAYGMINGEDMDATA